MSAVNRTDQPVPSVSPEIDRRLRGTAIGLSAVVATLYLALFFVVRGVETDAVPGVTDSTYGAYLFLAIAYTVSAVAYGLRDGRALWLAGTGLLVVVLSLFVIFGVGVLGPGLFAYEALAEATPVALWAGVISGLEVVLLGVLVRLVGKRPPELRHTH